MEVKKYKAQLFNKMNLSLGESPFYDPRYGRFSWVDIMEGRLYTLKEGEEAVYHEMKQKLGAAVPMKDSDGFAIAGQDGIYVYVDGEQKLICDMSKEFEEFRRSNDAKADPAGRLWFGSSVDDSFDHEPSGNLYLLSDGKATVMQADTRISNGMAWNMAHDKFYFSDSLFNAVFVYDYDNATGEASGRKKLFDVTDEVPDGMCIDAEDNLWVAVWGGRRIECHDSSTGELIAEVEVPAEHVTSCCFCGENMDTLFITTAGNGLEGEYDGSLFTCKVDVKGLAPDYFVQ